MNFDDSMFFACELYSDPVDLKTDIPYLDSGEKDSVIVKDLCSYEGCDKGVWMKGLCILHMGRTKRVNKPPAPNKKCYYCGKPEELCVCECFSCGQSRFDCSCCSDSDDDSESQMHHFTQKIIPKKILPTKRSNKNYTTDLYLIDCPRCGEEEKCSCYENDQEIPNFQVLPRKKYFVTGESLPEEQNLFLRGVPTHVNGSDEEKPYITGMCSRLCWKGTSRERVCNKDIYAKSMCYYHWKKNSPVSPIWGF